ncbi:MAG: nuclear transport factor 2 family protein [Chloroflexota bacterium]
MLRNLLIVIPFVFLVGCTTASIFQTATSNAQNQLTLREQQQVLIEKDVIVETVNQLFISTDNRDWDTVKSIFAAKVLFDMTSLVGGDPVTLTSQEIVDAWDVGLAPIEAIHHQVSNFIVDINTNQDEAEVFNYGFAVHYLPNSTGENTRTFVGSYTFHFTKIEADWRIDAFKFDAKYVDGNLDLEADAMADRLAQLPAAIQCYIEAVNEENLDSLTACFVGAATIVDVSRSIEGLEAIRNWADREVIGGRLDALGIVEESEDTITLLVNFAPSGVGGFEAHYAFTFTDDLITGMDLQYAP